ncbi:MAG: helix-turn-helix transcriptional regulator [Clostridia bacterium]|nr:helix-turn-helix transcriptional regulator [Clostridia bacterium]
MELDKKLQELRNQKGLTQDELAEKIFVSRTAISKWESGRGYPNIESLKALSKFFGVTVDELLSGYELLAISEEDGKKKENHFRDIVFGLLDVCVAMLIFLPFFGQKNEEIIQGISLISLNGIAPYLKFSYYVFIVGIIVSGIITLSLQNCERAFWIQNKRKLSLLLNTFGVLLFIVSRQPYAATFLLVFLIIKVLMLVKWQ